MMFSMLLCIAMLCFTPGKSQDAFSDSASWPVAEDMQEDKKGGGAMLEALMGIGKEDCYGRRCAVAVDCCKGSVCVDVDGLSGTCLPVYGKKDGESCESDSDCESGLICGDSPNSQPPKTCQIEGRNLKKKAYNDECVTSSECDAGRGLCCQILKRHRMAPKKVCHYFMDPLSCIGKIDTDMKFIHYIPNPFFKARLG